MLYLWIPEGITDNVVPGLDSILTYTQSKYATLTALQNSITNINNTINNEIQNLQTEIANIEINNPDQMHKFLSSIKQNIQSKYSIKIFDANSITEFNNKHKCYYT